MPLNLIFINPGNYTIDDNGVPGDNTSVVRDGTGTVIFTIVHPADSLGFTVTTPGVHLTINLTDSLGAADLTIGSLTSAAASPDSITVNNIRTTGTVTLVANGAITELGSDAGADIVAGAIILSAGDGVGTAANAIETQTGGLEAETNTGGINLSNFGSVQIGAISPDVDGLDVTTSGDIKFSTTGSIFLAEGNSVTAQETVHGGGTSGNVTLTAIGANADIIGSVDNSAVTAPRGNILLQAGRDVQLGTLGADFNNDVLASGSVTFNAGRDVIIDGFADIMSDVFGLNTGGDLVFTAGRDIHVLDAAGTSASINASGSAGADLILTTGPNGMLTVNGPGAFAANSASGDVVVNADRVVIASDSGISATSGTVTIRPVTAGREIILGPGTDFAFAIELSDAELGRIFASDLTIGSTSTGTITVLNAILSPASANITLRSAEDIWIGANFTTTNSLTLRAGNNLYHTAGTITTGTLAAFVDASGNDAGAGGFGQFGAVVATTVTLDGAGENDTLKGTENIDQTVHGNGGNDTITSSGEGHYFGGSGNDLIFAGLSSGLPEVLDGGTGIDTLDTRSFNGNYIINLATGATNFGYESFVNFENIITGDGNDEITGTSGNNVIRTNGGADTIDGGGGNDWLDGGVGADTMRGGPGDDDFIVDDAGDVAIEAANSGNDRVLSSVSYSLAGQHIERLRLTGFDHIDGTGNSLANTIAGNDGNNVIDGKTGADRMAGGLGNDTYIVDNAGDTVVEASGQGTDTVRSSVTFSLAGQHIENLILTGSGNINGTGNSLANTITGNAGNNKINGSSGADTMAGGLGNDTYIVDNAGDVVIEANGEGTDTVESSVAFSLSGSFVENLILTGSANVNGGGNSLDNSITGNAGNNTLNGRGGADTMIGRAGNDTYIVDNAGDKVIEADGEGNDTVESSVAFSLSGSFVENLILTGSANINGGGNSLDNVMTGNSGNNTLNGRGGADTMQGGLGNDTYVVDNAGDVVIEASGQGTDTVQSSVAFSLSGSFVENLILTGSANINGGGNSLDNSITGNSGSNVLTGRTGNDILTGNAGADAFVFNTALNATTNVDTITDFQVNLDKIRLDDAIFVEVGAGLTAGEFVANASGTATTAAQNILYNTTDGRLFYDPDGTGAQARVHFATLNAGLALDHLDFVVI